MRRAQLAILTAAVIALATLGVAAPATADPSPSPSPATSADASQHRTVIPLDYPVQLADAVTAGSRSPYEVVGYRYLNPGVEGEYYPTDGYTAEDFLAHFATSFGMTPSIVGLVVLAQQADDGTLAPIVDAAARSTQDVMEGLPRFDSPVSKTGTLWDQSRAAEQAATSSTATPAAAADALLTTQWLPGWSQISLASFGAQADITTQHVWTTSNGEDIHAIPDGWTVEFKVALHNETIEANDPGGMRQPIFSCTAEPNVKDLFWAKNYDWSSWSVFQVGSTTATTLGAYADTNDLTDECSRQNLSIGVGFPHSVPTTPNGNEQLGTEIVAPKGTVAVNRVGASIEAKEGISCAIDPAGGHPYNRTWYFPDTDCAGLAVSTPFPTSAGPQTRILLSDQRGAAYPSAPTVRVLVYTDTNGLPESCVSYWQTLFLDSSGNPVPQRLCSAG